METTLSISTIIIYALGITTGIYLVLAVVEISEWRFRRRMKQQNKRNSI